MTTDPAATAPLPGDATEARHRLPARARRYWRVSAAAVGVPIVTAAAAGAWWLTWFTPPIRWAIVAALAAWLLLVDALIAPPVRYHVFWYALSQTEIDIQHGLFVITRTVVPMNRVQYLKTRQGPIEARFRLATLHIHTAAGAVEVRGLASDEAERVRGQIAALADLADDV